MSNNMSRKWVFDTSKVEDYYSINDIKDLDKEIESFPDFLKGLIKVREFSYYEMQQYIKIIENLFSDNYEKTKMASRSLVKLFFDIYYDYETDDQIKVDNLSLFTQPNVIRSIYIILKEVKTRTMILDDQMLLKLNSGKKEEDKKTSYKVKEYLDVWKIELKEDVGLLNLYSLSLELKVLVSDLINEPFSVIQSYMATMSIRNDLMEKELSKNK